jgi:hypothetical protein
MEVFARRVDRVSAQNELQLECRSATEVDPAQIGNTSGPRARARRSSREEQSWLSLLAASRHDSQATGDRMASRQLPSLRGCIQLGIHWLSRRRNDRDTSSAVRRSTKLAARGAIASLPLIERGCGAGRSRRARATTVRPRTKTALDFGGIRCALAIVPPQDVNGFRGRPPRGPRIPLLVHPGSRDTIAPTRLDLFEPGLRSPAWVRR